MYGCESWTIKKAERQRIDAFEPRCWRRLLRVPWTARRSNHSILKEISPGCSLKGLILKLKLQYSGHLMRRVDSLEKTLMLGKIEGRRRGDDRGWDGWMASLTQWTWVWVDSGSWWWTGRPGVLRFQGFQRVRHDWATELSWIHMLHISIRQIYDEPSSSLLSENSLFSHMFQFLDFSIKELDRCILFYFSCHNCTWIRHTWLVGHYCYTWIGWSPVMFRTPAWMASSEIPCIQLALQQGEHGFDTKYMGFPGGPDGKESACSAGDQGSIPGSGRSPGEGNGKPLQYFCLENPT